MLFRVSRTSQWSDEVSPLDGATLQPVENWQTRAVSEEEFNRRFSEREGLWASKGKNHKLTPEGWVTRQMEDIQDWCIEINSLEDLIGISEREGRVIVNPGHIEIYDDYRE